MYVPVCVGLNFLTSTHTEHQFTAFCNLYRFIFTNDAKPYGLQECFDLKLEE